jgi:type 2 lantibiotic biosynthesis protein LanM
MPFRRLTVNEGNKVSSHVIQKENLQNPKALTNSLKTLLTNRTAGLYERLNLNYSVPTDWQAPPEALERLERWRKMVEVGVDGQFEQRLRLDNLDLQKITYALSDDFRLPGDEQTSADWLNLLDEYLTENASVLLDLQTLPENATLPYSFIDATNPVMFEEALAGLVRVAGRKLKERAGTAFSLLSFTAQRQLEFSLLADIATLTTNVLCEEFLNFRIAHSPALLFSPVPAKPTRQTYRRFVEELLAGGWLNLFEKYSVLARLLGTLLNDWLVATTEVLQRLEADFSDLQQKFGLTTPRLVRYSASVSDAHNGHRGVVLLTFEDGAKLVYKPRNLGAEEAFGGWLDWLNEQKPALDLKTYRILNRNNYGWVEFIEAKPCESENQVADFYRRCGMLLAVFYLLGTTDCHQENIIACGAYPVMIDAEAVLSYRLQPDNAEGETNLEYEALDESVLRTHLLPFWGKTPIGGYADYSGLSLGRTTTSQTYSTRTWEHLNTDYLRKVTHEITADAAEPFDNVPRLHGKPVSPAPYLPQIVAGFEEVYRLFMSQSTATADALAVFNGREIRLIFRATQLYASLLYNSYHPAALKNGVDRSLDLDILSRGLLTPENRRFWQLLAVEREALERGDIPLFSGLADSTDLELPGGAKLSGFSRFSACEMVHRRLARLNETDLAQQIRFIRNSFYTVMTNLQGVRAAVSASVPAVAHTEPADAATLINEARRIAETLKQEAITTKNGGLNWVAPELVPDGKVYAYKGLGYSLYSGTGGVALFLAALYRVTGEATYREMSLRALQNIRDLTRNRVGLNQLARFTGIGGSFGLGSLVYTFVRTGQLLDEPALLDEAEIFAGQITPDLIAADRTFDPMLGSSGAIMGLLALQEARPANDWLGIAIACGEHLLAHRLTSAEGRCGWATFAGSPNLAVSGFAHGASGIGLALARLGEITGNRRFQSVAREAFTLENTRFDTERQNWASYLVENDPDPYFGIAWCHGAVGIGLSRLALPQTEASEREIQIALATTEQAGLHSFDQLCCGTAGRIELLVAASQKLQRPDLLATARTWANQMLHHAHENDGNYRFFANVPLEVSSPGLFQGITGVGYELLRAANPALVPSVAIWE